MIIEIEKVYRNNKSKSGKPYINNKTGNPYFIASVFDGKVWYTAFDHTGWTEDWNPGDKVEVEVEETQREWQGQTKTEYIIKQPSVRTSVSKIEDRLARLEAAVFAEVDDAQTSEQVDNKDVSTSPIIDTDDLPF